MVENNAKCSICGKPYHVCMSCREQMAFKPWRSVVDTIEHYKIYMVIASYTNKNIDKTEAKKELQSCDISKYKDFVPDIVKAIDEILKPDKKAIKETVTNEVKNNSVSKNTGNE